MAGSSKYRPGNTKQQVADPMGPVGTKTVKSQGQNKPVPGGPAGAGKFRGTSRVQNALLARQPAPPFRANPTLVNRPRSKGMPTGG